MSNIKTNAAICEICGGKLMLRSVDAFECESCGANYPKDWVKAKVQEIIGTVRVEGAVEVSGVESADALYKRALDWLDLQDKSKAVEVLQEMVEKYPGDKRGWQKLARVFPQKQKVNVALKFGDEELKILEKKRYAEIADFAQTICNEIRNGQGDKWIDSIRNLNSLGADGQGLKLKIHSEFDFETISEETDEFVNTLPCVKALLEEGLMNAQHIDALYREYYFSYSDRRKAILNAMEFAWDCKIEYSFGGATFIIGNIFVYQYTDTYDHSRTIASICGKVFDAQSWKQPFERIKNHLCIKCGGKRSFWSGHCACD